MNTIICRRRAFAGRMTRFIKGVFWGAAALSLLGVAGGAHAHFHIDAPASLSATGGPDKLMLSWEAPGGLITGYAVRWALNRGSGNWVNPNGALGEDIGTAPAHEILSLTEGKTYTVQVAAVNGGGRGAWSGSVAEVAGSSLGTSVIFDFRDNDGAAQVQESGHEYTVVMAGVNSDSATFSGTFTLYDNPDFASITLRNAANTISHVFTDRPGFAALNLALGANQWVIDVVTKAGSKTQKYHLTIIRTHPGAGQPVVTLVAGHESMRASWSALVHPGVFVQTYQVRWAPANAAGAPAAPWRETSVDGQGDSGELAQAGAVLEYTIGGLTNGSTYVVEVRSHNLNGDSPPSDRQTATPTATEDAALSQLVVTGSDNAVAALLPALQPGKTAYVANVANAVSGATLTAAARASGAGFTLKIGAAAAAAGSGGMPSASGAIAAGGSLDFVIVVTSSSGNTATTYTVTVNRARGAPAGVSAESGARSGTARIGWSAPASMGIISHRVRWRLADTDANPLTVTPGDWLDSNGADAECNNSDAADDNLCGEEISGAAAYTITGLTNGMTYDAAVAALTIAGLGAWSGDTAAQATPSDRQDATLSDLVITGSDSSTPVLTKSGALGAPGFDAEHETYTAEFAHTVVSVTATPTVRISGATVTVNGSAVESGATSAASSPEIIPGGSTTMRIVVTATDGAATKTYSVEAQRDYLPPMFASPQADLRFHAGAAQSVELPAAEGGRPSFTYALLGALPGGLAFTAADRTISGIPESVSAVAESTMTYTATDSNTPPAAVTHTFSISVAPALAFAAAAPGSLPLTFNAAASEILPQVTGGFAPIVYSLEGDALPRGLTFTASTRALAGAPKATGTFRITYKAADTTALAAGSVRADIQLEVAVARPGAPGGLSAFAANERLRMSWTAPSGDDAGGEAPSGYRVRWAEGSGSEAWINQNTGNGEPVDGTNHIIRGLINGVAYPVQVAAVNSAGAGEWAASVEGIPEAGFAFVSQQDDVRMFFSGAGAVKLPVAENGATPYTYALSGLPASLIFGVNDTRIFADGAPFFSGVYEDATMRTSTLTYRVTDADGATDSQEFRIIPDNLDVDRNGEINVHDGIMTARYLLGVRGAALVAGQTDAEVAVVEQSLATGANEIGNNNAALNILEWTPDAQDPDDFNANGILILRYLFGLRGDALRDGLMKYTENVDELALFRKSLEDRIETLLP